MTRTVFCKLLQQNLPGLDAPPFPGATGQEIFEHISEQAWQQWQDQQTMLINEKHLNMMDKTHRKYLTEQRTLFFSGERVDQAEGFIATEEPTG
jgi:Fe-S cluster biosynthesis and repair protein YggX